MCCVWSVLEYSADENFATSRVFPVLSQLVAASRTRALARTHPSSTPRPSILRRRTATLPSAQSVRLIYFTYAFLPLASRANSRRVYIHYFIVCNAAFGKTARERRVRECSSVHNPIIAVPTLALIVFVHFRSRVVLDWSGASGGNTWNRARKARLVLSSILHNAEELKGVSSQALILSRKKAAEGRTRTQASRGSIHVCVRIMSSLKIGEFSTLAIVISCRKRRRVSNTQNNLKVERRAVFIDISRPKIEFRHYYWDNSNNFNDIIIISTVFDSQFKYASVDVRFIGVFRVVLEIIEFEVDECHKLVINIEQLVR